MRWSRMPRPAADAAQSLLPEIENTDHAQNPVTIGRVSIHYA